jgi:peptidoglycan/xylan/chitin deacetylase (PgdA/CDA1 family)
MRLRLSRRTAVFLALAVPLALAPSLQVSVSQPAAAATNTVVSLTFDDGQASQAATGSMLATRGMTGTYYINSAQVGTSGYYMTWPQIHGLANAGNEIGGHTLNHVNLTSVSQATATTEVCQDRQNLLNQGFSPVSSFAYPEAAVNSTAKQVVQNCGYSSGRGVGNIYSNGACPGCPYAETVPPGDAYELKTPESAGTGTSLSELQSYVTDAETHGGGWVVLTFHGICNDSCTGENTLTTSTFTSFLDWLQPRSANGTVVRTVGQVMGGPAPPITPSTSILCNNATCSTSPYRTTPVNVTLTATGGTGTRTTRYTTDGSDPTTSPTATTYTGSFNVTQTTTVRYYTTDGAGAAETPKTQTVTIDTTPASTVVSFTFDDGHASHAATGPMLATRGMAGTYYINSAQVGTSGYYMTWAQIHALADAGNEIGGHTLHHVNLTNVSQATATTEVCQDRQNLLNQGFSPVTSFAYPEAAVNSTAKQVVQQCGYATGRGVGRIYSNGECPGCPYAETIPPEDAYDLRGPESGGSTTSLSDLQSYVTDAETHGGGWVVLSFHGICDNSCTGGNSLTTSIFTSFLDWLQPRSTNGTVVQTVGQVMGGPAPPSTPSTSIACGGATCSTGWYGNSVSVSLTATGGTGTRTTRYTTDGSDPTTSTTAATYTQPFSVTKTTTVRYYTTDSAGTAETPKSQQIRIDAAPPTVTLTSPAAGSYRRGTSISVAATATDAGTGGGAASGIARVVFRNGTSQLATDTTSPYQFTWKIPNNTPLGNHSLTAVATDVAGGSTTSAPVVVNVTRR